MTLSSSIFESVFNSAPIGNYLLSPTPEAIILAVNDALLKASSRRKEDLIGVSLFDAFPADPSDPEDTGELALRSSLARVIATGEPDTLPVQRYPIRVILPSGEIGYEERFWRAVNTPVFGPDGKILCISHTTTDITNDARTDAARRESEEKFRLMADAVPQIVWIADAEGRVEFFNQQWSKYTGLACQSGTAEELAAAVVHPDDVALTLKRFEQARCSGSTFEVEHRIRSVAGDYRWFLVRAQPYRDPISGEISRWFGASVDIHDRKQAEDELRLLAGRQTFQLALADCIRPLVDPEEVTAAASELLGQSLGAKRVVYGEVGESAQFIVMNCDWTDGTLPSMGGVRLRLNDFGPTIIDVLRAGRGLSVDDVTTNEHSAPYADAYIANGVRSYLAIPLMKSGRLSAILSVHDTVAHHWTDSDIAMAEDTVDRTWSAVENARAQAALRIERDRSRSIFDGMTEGFALFAHNWAVLEINAAGLRIAHRMRSEVIGKVLWEVWPEAVGTEAEKMYCRVMETKIPEILEYQQSFTNGPTAWIEVRAYPAGEHDLAVFFRDITERKLTEEKLKESDRRKDEFLAMLAHELRNPLAPIGAAAQLLQMAKLDEARLRQTSEIISRQVEHMTSLVNDLLDVSRVTRGLVKLDNAPQDIRHIVAEAVEQVTPLLRSRHHHLVMHLPPEITMVKADKKRLVQVIANILNNAAKYTDEGGHIVLKTHARASHVLIEVIDNGIGMSPELAARAFDLFAQAERSSDRSLGGLGLGLALVKSLVDLHGGTVTGESEGIGKGSKFTVCLPRLFAKQPLDERQDCGNVMQHKIKSLCVMVVDDNVDAAATLAMLLETLGHQVLVENEARRALERAKREAPDVCLLDIGLPGMDGNELAKRLRAHPQTAHSVLIAVTGYGQESDRKHAMAAGFDHHIVKPVDTRRLASILAGVSEA